MLDDGTTIAGATLDIGNSGEVYVQGSATLNHVTVANGNEIEIGTATFTGSTLILEGGTTISGGDLILDEAGDVVDIEVSALGKSSNGADATLDGVTMTNTGTIQVGATTPGAILALDDGTIIGGGTLQTFQSGAIEIQHAPLNVGPDAVFDGSTNLLQLGTGIRCSWAPARRWNCWER